MRKNDKINQKPKKELRDISPETRKNAAILVSNTLILTSIYFASTAIEQPILSIIVTSCFWIFGAGFIIAYVIYNRAFTRRGVSAEMLPDSWSDEKKAEFISDGQERLNKSKWMFYIMIPLIIPILLDAIVLFTWPIIQNLFSFI